MGFYGNITNNVKTNLQFDRKYHNRFEMESRCATDGVYAGRYVLIEYDLSWEDENLTNDKFILLYKIGNKFSTAYNSIIEPDYKEDTIYRIVKLNDLIIDPTTNEVLKQYYTNEYYIYKNNELILAVDSDSPYVTNFNIDRIKYGDSRGWDSTVWVKNYDNDGNPKYVNVAELNSVVPTFAISVDPPTDKPQAPHFDEAHTNIFYNLHLQPNWGFSVGEIDFNSDGFNADIKAIKNEDNYISINNISSNDEIYNAHDGTGNKISANDIKQLNINLPAIGNMMSNAWDIIHGPNRDNSPSNSLQGRLDFFTKKINSNEIPVQHQDGYLIGATIEDDDWIFTNVDSTIKTIIINHSFNEGQHKTATKDINNNGDTIDLYVPEVDDMGHVVGEVVTAVTLPYGFKTISTNGQAETIVEESGTNKPDIVSTTTQDTLTINSGNRWIRINNDDSNKTITIGHAVAGNETYTAGDTEESTPGFGDTFNVPYIKYDEMGHIKSNHVRSVKIPQGNLSDTLSTDTANVLTSIDFTPESGLITTTHQNVGTLKLTDYNSVNADDEAYIQAINTINQAFNKIDTRLDNKINALNMEEKFVVDNYSIVDSINQIDGKIEVTANKKLEDIQLANNLLSSPIEIVEVDGEEQEVINDNYIKKDDSLNTAFNKLQKRININENLIGNESFGIPGASDYIEATGLNAKIENVAKQAIISVESNEDTENIYSKIYTIKQNGIAVGDSINIPKDLVVQSGNVVTDPEDQKKGTYIELILANTNSDKIYIPVDSLIEYVTGGNTAEINVIVDSSHNVTASINNKSIGKDKLVEDVQASLGKADTAIQQTSVFTYGEGESAENKTIQQLFETVAELETRIKELEGKQEEIPTE